MTNLPAGVQIYGTISELRKIVYFSFDLKLAKK